MVIQFYL